ncbi:Wzz/FepE/Etk N-terminal domain-containing protein [Nocardioides litoris]|uniref:Wzz/FepE/Etk N-terminal domain-containing protein n=1 Tax=Nocardioides litoris TaxID=1926648 RepID=UPI00111EABE2|nr:Wzz/FepE/Etk N-terminal domain-containing protein [Nocardioides litoris]
MQPQDLVGALWRQRWLVLAVFVVTGLAVVVGVQLAPKTYTATTVVSATVDPEAPAVDEGELTALRGTLAALADSPEVVRAVQPEIDADRSLTDLRRSIEGRPVDGTVLVEVRARDRDPVVAAEIADAAAARLPFSGPVDGTFVVTVTTPAQPPATYSSPDLLLAGGAGLLVAVVVSCAAALTRDRRRSTVDRGRVAEEAAHAPLLAHVAPPRDLTTLPALYPGTAAADVFRHLRLALEAEASTEPVDVVVVAGIGGGEINVWLGANLAISLAGVGRRVVLVDGRLDGQGGGPDDDPHAVGLLEVLGGGLSLDDALVAGPVDGLSVLPAGSAHVQPPEVLIETRWPAVLQQARDRADVVVVLAPPMDDSDDARVMAAGGALLMAVPEGTVSVAALRVHSERVRSVGARLLGLVLVGPRAERLAA